MTTTKHDLAQCEKTGHAQYSYRNWTRNFKCPTCGREGKFNLNFLGQRTVWCDGAKFEKVTAEPTWKRMAERMAAYDDEEVE